MNTKLRALTIDPKLPPWQARSPRERLLMIDWVHSKLEDEHIRIMKEANARGCTPEELHWFFNLGPEIQSARNGDIEPLRKRLPHIAEFIHRPKRKRGQRFPKRTVDFDKAKAAALLVPQIRALWLQNYGKRNRPASRGPSAEEIAARYFGAEVEDVVRALKKLPAK